MQEIIIQNAFAFHSFCRNTARRVLKAESYYHSPQADWQVRAITPHHWALGKRGIDAVSPGVAGQVGREVSWERAGRDQLVLIVTPRQAVTLSRS